MKITSLLSTLFLIVTCSNFAYAQKPMLGGVDFTFETTGSKFIIGGGATFEINLTKNSGLETGLFYRSYKLNGFSNRLYYEISERHLSIPVLYKLYSSIINISAGPTFDFLLGLNQKGDFPIALPHTYKSNGSIEIGGMLKLSKRINFSDAFLLEPEIRYNYIFSSSRNYAGVGIAAKYKLQ